MNCILASLDIPYLDSLAFPTVLQTVAQCSEVCQEIFGIGDVDLIGVGVITADSIQVSLALLFSLFLIIDGTLMPAIRKDRNTTTVTIWLQKHHQMGLWSSLLFALTICLAGFIRQITGQITGIYENIATFDSICIIYLSLVLTAVCCYEKIHRPYLFTICFVATTIWAMVTLILSIISVKEENVFLACWLYAFKDKSPWKDETEVRMRLSLVQTTISIVFIAILLSIWLALRWYRCQEHRRQCVLRLLVLGVVVLSAFAAYNAVERLYHLSLIRYCMDILWKGETGYNKWGVGQIGAPLAWAPLLVDMVFDGLNRIRNWCYDRCIKRIRARVLFSTRTRMLQSFNGQREEDRH